MTDVYYNGGMPHDPQRGKPATTEYDEAGNVKSEFFMWHGKRLESRAMAEEMWVLTEEPPLAGHGGTAAVKSYNQIQK